MRSFRFGFQATTTDADDLVRAARAAEAAGFDIFQVGDHVGHQLAPFVALAAAAAATTTIRLGTLVCNNDLRHPVLVAQEVTALDQLSGGRAELGLGAGHSFTEYAALGRPFDPPRVRKARLAEAVEILGPLLRGEAATYEGKHYRVSGAQVLHPAQARVPLLVGVNGRSPLAHAARHADIVAPTMLGRTRADGQRHEVRWEAERLDATIGALRDAAGERWSQLELHALVQAVIPTDDRAKAAEDLSTRLATPPDDLLATPFLCLGTPAEMAQHLLACRARWGFNYFTVRDIEEFEPVMGLVRTLECRGSANS